jgi:GntR family transcriptional regulator
MRARGLSPGSRTLDLREIAAGARLGRILHVSPSEPVVAVKRLRLADGDPMANEEESSTLGVPLHSPALLFERVTRTAEGDVVEFTSSTYRGDRYRLVTEIGLGGRAVQPLVAGLDQF